MFLSLNCCVKELSNNHSKKCYVYTMAGTSKGPVFLVTLVLMSVRHTILSHANITVSSIFYLASGLVLLSLAPYLCWPYSPVNLAQNRAEPRSNFKRNCFAFFLIIIQCRTYMQKFTKISSCKFYI